MMGSVRYLRRNHIPCQRSQLSVSQDSVLALVFLRAQRELIFSCVLLHSSMQRESDRKERHHPLPRLPGALWEQPELCVEDRCY